MALTVINRTQGLVLSFFLLAWAAVITILVVAPHVYDQALTQAPGSLGAAKTMFVVALSAVLGVASAGVMRRWRWIFWLILAVFFLGVLRVPVAALQLSGHLAAGSPTWYIALQGAVGVIQFAIALAMLTGYRRSGIWGAF
jgi:hypothetical protein